MCCRVVLPNDSYTEVKGQLLFLTGSFINVIYYLASFSNRVCVYAKIVCGNECELCSCKLGTVW